MSKNKIWLGISISLYIIAFFLTFVFDTDSIPGIVASIAVATTIYYSQKLESDKLNDKLMNKYYTDHQVKIILTAIDKKVKYIKANRLTKPLDIDRTIKEIEELIDIHIRKL